MFRTFAKVPNVGAQRLFLFHPTDLIAVLELAWDRRAEASALVLGHPLHRSDLNRFEDTWFGRRDLTPPAPGLVALAAAAAGPQPADRHHRQATREPRALGPLDLRLHDREHAHPARSSAASCTSSRTGRSSGRRAWKRCTGCGIPRSCSTATLLRSSSPRSTARPGPMVKPRGAPRTIACSEWT